MERQTQSDGRWYRIEPEVLKIPLALPIYNNFESFQKNIRQPKLMGSKKISPKPNESEDSYKPSNY
ncbi:hypothetical protein BpHYR1_010406 [Brachionus plicatilis]|uniref:Uncharacterized protein n=1 Tax=Brachionus plicatilis TaxID=10195 RepID=A0A3M7QED0_BRAPC|nr:hypothetical protein BpHYR1_010406 [Brachionus plicatilis]